MKELIIHLKCKRRPEHWISTEIMASKTGNGSWVFFHRNTGYTEWNPVTNEKMIAQIYEILKEEIKTTI